MGLEHPSPLYIYQLAANGLETVCHDLRTCTIVSFHVFKQLMFQQKTGEKIYFKK